MNKQEHSLHFHTVRGWKRGDTKRVVRRRSRSAGSRRPSVPSRRPSQSSDDGNPRRGIFSQSSDGNKTSRRPSMSGDTGSAPAPSHRHRRRPSSPSRDESSLPPTEAPGTTLDSQSALSPSPSFEEPQICWPGSYLDSRTVSPSPSMFSDTDTNSLNVRSPMLMTSARKARNKKSDSRLPSVTEKGSSSRVPKREPKPAPKRNEDRYSNAPPI